MQQELTAQALLPTNGAAGLRLQPGGGDRRGGLGAGGLCAHPLPAFFGFDPVGRALCNE